MRMLNFCFFLLVLTAIPLSSKLARCESVETDSLIARVIGDVGGSTFQLDISDQFEKVDSYPVRKTTDNKISFPDKLPIRVVEINCISKCVKKIEFSENVDDFPLGAFRLRDNTSQFVTIWVGATAYWTRIYNIGQGGVKKVLEQASKSAPQFGVSEDGSPVVIMDDQAASIASDYILHGKIWRWNGEEYKISSELEEDRGKIR